MELNNKMNKNSDDQKKSSQELDQGSAHSSSSHESAVIEKPQKQSGKKKTWKKPEGMPKRPLSAYNLFFQKERQALLGAETAKEFEVTAASKRKHRKTHGKIGFADMARAIGLKWKTLDTETRSVYEAKAKAERVRYAEEMEAYRNNSAAEKKGPLQQVSTDVGMGQVIDETAAGQVPVFMNAAKMAGVPNWQGDLPTGFCAPQFPQNGMMHPSLGFQGRDNNVMTMHGMSQHMPRYSFSAPALTSSTSLGSTSLGFQDPNNSTGMPSSFNRQLDEASLLRFQLAAVADIRGQLARCPPNHSAPGTSSAAGPRSSLAPSPSSESFFSPNPAVSSISAMPHSAGYFGGFASGYAAAAAAAEERNNFAAMEQARSEALAVEQALLRERSARMALNLFMLRQQQQQRR